MNNKAIFLAAPISGFSNDNEYRGYREKVLKFMAHLRANSYEVYSEIEKVTGKNNYSSPDHSAEDDFNKINDLDIFLLLHPRRVQTSSLIELGYAYAKGKTIVIIGSTDALPYLALGLPAVCPNVRLIDSSELDTNTFIHAINILNELITYR